VPYHAKQGERVIARVVHKARSFAEAEEWDILQNVRMSADERRHAALELKRRVFGDKQPDVRESTRR
jgi:hypothetical protein